MLREAIFHKQYSQYAFGVDKNTLVLRIRTRKNEMTTCIVYYEEKYDSSLKGKKMMEKVASDELFDYYEARLCIGIKRFKYMFYLEDAYEAVWYNQSGFHKHKPAWGHFSFSYICEKDIVEGVEWLENTVIYQIFPDRFKRQHPIPHSSDGFYGGNLRGMISGFEYIKSLGVGTIYLNPVFKSRSYHRYDIDDYYEVDPLLGNKEQLKEFIDLCHKSNIKVIFDAVLNHTGTEFFAFRDVVQKGIDSAYKDWFFIDAFPLSQSTKPNYECFGYFGGMPKLNTSNPEVVEYLIGVLKYWTCEFGIDGWRFDVADEIDRDFWRGIRRELKALKSDIVLLGEIFDEASSWLEGDQFDTVINYPLKSMINDLFAYKSINCTLFKQRISGYLMNFKSGVLNSLVNVISTHDTPRFLTLCKESEKRFELAVVFQFTFPGVPLVYYGDEIGMKGEADPDCRRPMIWDSAEWNTDILKLYRFLIALRKESEALRKGDFIDIKVNGNSGILAYGRKTEKEFLIILINTTHAKTNGNVNIATIDSYLDIAYDFEQKITVKMEGRVLKVQLKPYEWRIFRIDKSKNQLC